jgi:hypothetical protein
VGEAFGSTKKSVDFLDFGIEPCMDILPTWFDPSSHRLVADKICLK